MRARAVQVVLSCEHGGARVPRRYAGLFAERDWLLGTHRALDVGALALARAFAKELQLPLHAQTITRLLVDCNRSPDSPTLFSSLTARLTQAERQAILAEHYAPYRERVEAEVRELARRGPVVHLSVHSFTPVFHGHVRKTDVGLLYDPKRSRERAFCDAWQEAIAADAPRLRIHHNEPYRGDADGLVTTLRGVFPAERYLGLELEVSQRFARRRPRAWRALLELLPRSFSAAARRGAPLLC